VVTKTWMLTVAYYQPIGQRWHYSQQLAEAPTPVAALLHVHRDNAAAYAEAKAAGPARERAAEAELGLSRAVLIGAWEATAADVAALRTGSVPA